MSGIEASALTIAYPMRWVNDTLPPRPRDRWLLITMRLSMSSFAGTTRTLVAVGTARLRSMLAAVRAAAPRRRTSSAPEGAAAAGLAFTACELGAGVVALAALGAAFAGGASLGACAVVVPAAASAVAPLDPPGACVRLVPDSGL